MMERRISVISVNYNGYGLTCAMIDSLRRHVTTPLEIVIVDNGSARDEAAPLRERYPDVKVLRSERNLGFAGGNNLGFAAATGQQSPLRSYCLTRNRLLFAWRNLRGGARLLSVADQLCIAAPKNAVSALAHRRGDLAKAVCRGVRDFFTQKDKQS